MDKPQVVLLRSEDQGRTWHHTSMLRFGEPAAARLPDGSILIVLWCIHPSARGIAYVKARLVD